uniref:Stage II sporulation protein M n=1 Tax=Candidatus Methanogaster sp. ANME-2c ERB4 TaxID=2759911 RepID=A0A7G9YJH0_9EURY|nr:hypothetical protein KNONPEEI_00009 [Methanosarcinales archaeon ANME-2c ERB4]QNO48154.1 hypothetical protein GOJLPIDM_00010 [Methanosarcinales archaeon ANME-2c ERB4]
MAQDVGSYFRSGFHQVKSAPGLIIPSLVSNTLSSTVGWAIILTFLLLSLPILAEVAPIVERNQDLISEIIEEENFEDDIDPKMEELVEEFTCMVPEMIGLSVLFLILLCVIVVVSFALYAWVQAGTIGYLWQGVTTTTDFRNFLYYSKEYSFQIMGLWLSMAIFSIVLFLVPFFTLVFIPPPANIAAFVLSIILCTILWLVAMVLLFFAEESIVIEGMSVIDSIKRSKDIVTGNIGSVLIFIFILTVVLLTYGVISGIFEVIAVLFNSSLLPLFMLFSIVILVPWIQLSKLNFFLDRTGVAVKEMDKEIEIIKTVRKFIARSPYILITFVRNNKVYLLASLSVYGIGIAIGYYMGHSFSFLSEEIMMVLSEGWEEQSFLGPYISMPVIDSIYYFSNNINVAMALGLSGIFLGVPTIAGSIVNGTIIGLVYGILPAETATMFIAVHGIPECIAFAIATAAGIKLGVKIMKSPENGAEALMETLEVVLATALLIGIAAFLEAFITPIVISMMI